jgi:hypothetical protein
MTEHLPECPCRHHPGGYYWCICHRLRACETRSLDAAVQRVEALAWDYTHGRGELITRAKAIAAIKGGQP